MAYTKSGTTQTIHTPDGFVIDRHTPRVVRQLIGLLLQHQDRLASAELATVAFQVVRGAASLKITDNLLD